MRNLFIVNTPFHLLTAFILQNDLSQAENYLALVNPHSYEEWQDSPMLSYLSSKEAGYREVFPLNNFMKSKDQQIPFKTQIEKVRNTIGQLNIDQIYLGSDIYPQNQYLVAALGKEKFFRYEDGLYSYYNENRRRGFWKEIFHKYQMKYAMAKAGIKSNLVLNTSTASASPAGLGDFMYKPHLLQRFSPAAKAITKEAIQRALAKIKEAVPYENRLQGPALLYLSQPLVEKKLITLEAEIAYLQTLQKHFPGGQIVYKAHPNDHKSKLGAVQKAIPSLQFWPTKLPAEIILLMEDHLQGVISYESSTLMYTDIFAPKGVIAISLSDCTGHPMFSKYKEIMVKAGVHFPKDLLDLAKLWTGHLEKNS